LETSALARYNRAVKEVPAIRINDDLTVRVAVHAAKAPWVPSPAQGVDRRMLFRIGDEIARATSIVRFAPGSRFPMHVHGGGEEILVLDGVFQDETGDYPAGSYLRNPPGTAHAPRSDDGCVLFVKLWQFRKDEQDSVALKPNDAGGVLYDAPTERVWIENWAPGANITPANVDGLELLVLAGSLSDGAETFEPLSWLRLPPSQPLDGAAGAEGATLWLKAGPLLQPDVCVL
jgi:anti-sigma factor ChrR (cupin superfamily)